MAKIDESLAKIKAIAAKKMAEPKLKKKAEMPKQLSLELWPDAVRGMPNAVLRGALFGVSKVRQTYQKRTLIAALEGYEIRYLGTALNQTDLDVWETLLHLARLQPLGTQVEFTAHALLKKLGRGTSGKHHEELKEEMMRLVTGGVEITWTKEQKTFAGTLVSSFFRDEETGRYVVKFNPDMAQLYGVGHTYIDWVQREALGNNNLAKWLHGFYASHAKPFPYKVETLHSLSGSTSSTKEFRRLLKAAMSKLVDIGAIKSWDIDAYTDLVSVVNIPSQSQRKNLSKRS